MSKGEAATLPTKEHIDAVLKFRAMFSRTGVRHSQWHIKPPHVRWCELSEEAEAFRKALSSNGFVVGFNWGAWQDEAKAYVMRPEFLGDADLLTIRRLLTLHVRKDRFCEGHFAAMIENGHIALVLRRLANIRVEMDGGFVMDDVWSELDLSSLEYMDKSPWEDVEASRRNRRLQKKHPATEGQSRYLADAKACPKCQTPAEALSWFYCRSPKETWENLCGTAGWMAVCDRCHVQVNYFEEVIS